MADYSYKARNQDGSEISGVVVAPTENIAYGILRDKQLTIVDLKEQIIIKSKYQSTTKHHVSYHNEE